jgi:hypothetical protein
VKLAAVRDALDRAGLKPHAKVEFAARPLAPVRGTACSPDQLRPDQAMKCGEPYTPAPAPALPPTDDGLEVLDTELVRAPPETHSDSRRAMRR